MNEINPKQLNLIDFNECPRWKTIKNSTQMKRRLNESELNLRKLWHQWRMYNEERQLSHFTDDIKQEMESVAYQVEQ